jgi:ribulose-5-phosphate 4-epimerase/fuculose-1-phosphate aldolase
MNMKSRTIWIYGPALLVVAGAFGWHAAHAQTADSFNKAVIDDLVVANRALASEEIGFLDTAGHVSVRNPGNPNHFFLSRWIAPGMVTAKDVIEYDLDAKPITGNRRDQYLERYIHSEIYKARPDVNAIVHAHTPELVAFGVSSVPLSAYDRLRAGFVNLGLPNYDIRKFNNGRTGIIESAALGQELAKVLGNKQAVLLLGHGVVVVDASIYGLVGRANGLRNNAKLQQQAILLGPKLTYLEPAPTPARAAAATPQQRVVPSGNGGGAGGDRAWEYWKHNALVELDAEAKGPKPPTGEVAKTRAEVLEDLARANRLLASKEMGFLDAFGHVSVRNPADPNHYFLSRYVSAGSVTPEGIIEYDLNSVPVGSNRTDNYQERFIHGEIYKARPDVMAVVHSHTPELIAFGASTVPLRPVENGGTFIGTGLPLFDIRKFPTGQETIISTAPLGRALAETLGKKSAVLLLGHGAVMADSSLYALVGRAHGLRMNARIEEQAIALGGTVSYLDTPPPPPPAPRDPNAPPRLTGEGGGRGWEYWVRTVSVR